MPLQSMDEYNAEGLSGKGYLERLGSLETHSATGEPFGGSYATEIPVAGIILRISFRYAVL